MKTKLIQMCVLAACAAFEGWAMPSEEEVEKAVPKVERMLSSEKVALESGKMKRGEVAAAAMKLASGVNDEAAKLLLMKGAFVLHVKDGNLEKAVETMNALETAIADVPPQVVTNIIETALLGLPDKNDGARLYRLLDAGKVSPRVGFGESKNMKAVVNGYTWSYSVRNGEATIVSPSGKSGECAISPKPTGDVTIPSTLGGAKVTSIGNSAFAYCREMKSVMIPNSVTNIGFWAFYQCRRLPSVIIPEGVISIQELAFEDCWHGLTSVTIPSTVTNIGWCAFAGNGGKLTAFDVSLANPKYASVKGILCSKDGKTVIAGVNGDVKIPEGVTSIGNGAFRKYSGLISVEIPASVKNIGKEAFSNCMKLESVTMRGGKPDSGDKVFTKCDKLKSIHVPANAKSWAGMKEWQRIPLVFDGEPMSQEELAREAADSIASKSGAGLVHRWSFGKDLVDDIGNVEAKRIGKSVIVSDGQCVCEKGGLDLGNVLQKAGTPFTVEMWYQETKREYGGRVFSASVPGVEVSWATGEENEGFFYVLKNKTEWFQPARGTPEMQFGLKHWYYLAITYDGANVTGYKCDLEGDRQVRSYSVAVDNVEGERELKLGSTCWSEAPGIYAKFDEVRIWSVCKSKEDIDSTIKAGPDRVVKPMVSVGNSEKSQSGVSLLRGRQNPRQGNTLLGRRLQRRQEAQKKIHQEIVDGYTWSFRANNGEAEVVAAGGKENRALSPSQKGSVVIPATLGGLKVTSIGHDAFKECTELESVTIPEGVVSIGERAFWGCKLTSLNLPEGLKVIGGNAFRACSGLTEVRIPASVESIGGGVFTDCTGLKRINVAADNQRYVSVDCLLLTKDRTVLMMCPGGVTSVTIPEGVASIGETACEGCCGLTSVTFPSSVKQIGSWAFKNCKGLKSVSIPSNVKTVGWWAFQGCDGLTSVTLAEGVTRIEQGAFYECRNLASVNLPQGLESIAGNAFMLCQHLAPMTIPSSVTNIGGAAFAYCGQMRHIDVADENRSFTSIDGVVYTKDRTELVAFPSGKTSVTIPESVTIIRDGSFTSGSLTSVTIPPTVRTIGAWAFSGSGLTSVTLPPELTCIDVATFWGCHNLTSVTIPEGMTEIKNNAFRWCGKLTTITLPKSVRTVERETFYECGGLMSVSLRMSSPPVIQNDAFKGCGKLAEIRVPSDSMRWSKFKSAGKTVQGIPIVLDPALK